MAPKKVKNLLNTWNKLTSDGELDDTSLKAKLKKTLNDDDIKTLQRTCRHFREDQIDIDDFKFGAPFNCIHYGPTQR